MDIKNIGEALVALKNMKECNGSASFNDGLLWLEDGTSIDLGQLLSVVAQAGEVVKESRHLLVHVTEDWDESGHEMGEVDAVVDAADKLLDRYDESLLPFETSPELRVQLAENGVKSTYTATASRCNDFNREQKSIIYDEMAIGISNEVGEVVADVYIKLEEGEPVVLVTTDGYGDGDHDISVYPLRPKDEAVVINPL